MLKKILFLVFTTLGVFFFLDGVQAQSKGGRAKTSPTATSRTRSSNTSRASRPSVRQSSVSKPTKSSVPRSASSIKAAQVRSGSRSISPSRTTSSSSSSRSSSSLKTNRTSTNTKNNLGRTKATPKPSTYTNDALKKMTSTSTSVYSGYKESKPKKPKRVDTSEARYQGNTRINHESILPQSMQNARPDFNYTPRTPRPKNEEKPKTRQDTIAPEAPSVSEANPIDPEDPPPEEDPGDDPDEDETWPDDGETICCSCCGCPWWDCIWFQFWSPICWGYWGNDCGFWNNYWNPLWYPSYANYHTYYDFDEYYPSIYTPAALTIDPTSEAIEYIDAGTALFRNGQYLEALHQYRLATLADLSFAVPKFAYAHALFALGVYEYAAYEIQMGLYLLPEWPEMGGDLKLMYGDTGDFEQQLSALKAHLEVSSGDEDALLVLGYVLYFSGELYGAEEAFSYLVLSQDLDTLYAAERFMESITNIRQSMESAVLER